MLISRVVALLLALAVLPSIASAQDCAVRDFLRMPLPASVHGSAVARALEAAYPGVAVDVAARTMTVGDRMFALGSPSDRPMSARIADASIFDQFAQVYPLAFDLSQRRAPWFDPGRARNEGMFRALYGQSEGEVAARLAQVTYRGGAVRTRFAISSRHCAARQLQAALDAIAAEGPEMDRFFTGVGGSFNWRVIAGTTRLSAHSYGIAVDFNTELGGYWRWSGEAEGRVGEFANRYPEVLVQHMERFGFIWGGKWHHYDGMHFEYRPELILHARLVSGGAVP
jgi:hypothetical protein